MTEDQPVRRRSSTMTTDDLNQIRASIESLGNRMMDEFNRVRAEMQLSMQNYTLNAVHQKDLDRLNEKDQKQQEQIDAMEKKLDGLAIRYITVFGGVISILVGIFSILHFAHFI